MGHEMTKRAMTWARGIAAFVTGLALYGVATSFVISTPSLVSPAHAGGLYLLEFAVPTTGTAGAGANAKADDASTVTTNPAGMTRLKGNALSLGAGLLIPSTEFDSDPSTSISGGDGGEQGSPAPILSAFYVHSLSDDLKLGTSLFAFSGAALDPDNDWVGRFALQEVEFLTLSVNPSVAYRINDWLSIGAGAVITYAKMDFKLAAPPPDGTGRVNIKDADDVGYGFDVGVLVELNRRTRFGLLYYSGVDLVLEGDVNISPIGIGAGINLALPLAETVRGSVYHELNDRVALLASVAWEDWSVLAKQFVSTSAGSTVLPRNWEDTWHFAVGVQYRTIDRWLLQAGFAYDTSPVDSEDRTPDLPVDRQIRFAVGAEYPFSPTMTIGGSFVYTDLGDAEIDRTFLKGDYDENSFLFFGLYSKWKW